MSWTRIVLFVILLLLLIGVIGLGGFQWYKSYPSYYFGRAERAIAQEDYESAKLNLMRLVIKHPTHAEGHELLSRVVLDEARAGGRPASYVANPAAIAHLVKAVELKPQDMELRRRLLSAYLQSRQIGKAAEIAEQVYAEDKTSGDAHLALTWRAIVAKNQEEAERLFAESNNVVSRHVFHEFALKLTYYSQVPGAENPEAYRRALLEAINLASGLSEEELRLLTYRDREVMLNILVSAQAVMLEDADKTRVSVVLLDTCDKLRRSELLDKQAIAKAASQSQHLLLVNSPETALSEDHRQARANLVQRSGEIAAGAVASAEESGNQSPVIAYWTNAIALLGQGRNEEALRNLAQGIGVAEGLGAKAEIQRLHMHLMSARVLMAGRQYAQAVEHLEHLKGHQDYDGWGHLLRGKMALEDGQMAAALSELQQAEEQLDDKLEVRMALAKLYQRTRQWERAIPYLEALLAQEDEQAPKLQAWRERVKGRSELLHLALLRARLEVGQWQEAQDQLLALKETPVAPQAWGHAIEYLWNDNQTEKAWTYLRRARDRYPEDLALAFLEVKYLNLSGKPARAEFVFQDFAHENPERRLAMARWFIHEGDNGKALRLLDDLRDDLFLTPKSRNTANILIGQALVQSRNFDDAEAAIDTLLANPETESVGCAMKLIIAAGLEDHLSADQWLRRMAEANARQIGADRVVVPLQHFDGTVVQAVASNAYYW